MIRLVTCTQCPHVFLRVTILIRINIHKQLKAPHPNSRVEEDPPLFFHLFSSPSSHLRLAMLATLAYIGLFWTPICTARNYLVSQNLEYISRYLGTNVDLSWGCHAMATGSRLRRQTYARGIALMSTDLWHHHHHHHHHLLLSNLKIAHRKGVPVSLF